MGDLLGRIYATQRAIATSQAKTLPDAAVQIRRALAAIEAHDCKSPFAGPGRTEIMLLASVLAVVERLAWVPPRASVVVKKVGLR